MVQCFSSTSDGARGPFGRGWGLGAVSEAATRGPIFDVCPPHSPGRASLLLSSAGSLSDSCPRPHTPPRQSLTTPPPLFSLVRCLPSPAGFFEEVLFRGVIQQWLSAVVGGIPALAISSVLFGLAHSPVPGASSFTEACYGANFGLLYMVRFQLGVATGPLCPPSPRLVFRRCVVVW